MSLDEILKPPVGSTIWKIQRKKLIRLVISIGIFSFAFLVLVVIFSGKLRDRQSVVSSEEEEVQTLSRLLSVRKDADKLRSEIQRLGARHPSSDIKKSPSAPRTLNEPEKLQVVDFDPGDSFSMLKREKSELYIPTGAVFLAKLMTPIKTSVERTFVMARTTREFRMDMKRRIAAHSKLIGRARLNPVLKGVVVEFETLVSPAGIESSLNSLALSRNALPEIDGLYFSNKLETYGAALAFGFLSGFASAAREREITPYGTQPTVNLNNQILSGLSTASFQVAEDILRDVQNRAVEYVVVPAGEQIFVVLTRRYEIARKDGT